MQVHSSLVSVMLHDELPGAGGISTGLRPTRCRREIMPLFGWLNAYQTCNALCAVFAKHVVDGFSIFADFTFHLSCLTRTLVGIHKLLTPVCEAHLANVA